MSNKDKKLAILRLLDQKCKAAFRQFLEAKANEEAYIAGAKQWDREHPGVCCFSMNTWNPQIVTSKKITKETIYREWQELCDYALNQLVE